MIIQVQCDTCQEYFYREIDPTNREWVGSQYCGDCIKKYFPMFRRGSYKK